MAEPQDKPRKADVREADGQFKPGHPSISNGAGGRPPKTHSVSTMLRELIDGDPLEVVKQWGETKTGAMVVAKALYKKMAAGSLTAIHEGLDRLEGKAIQNLTTQGDVQITVRYEGGRNEKVTP